MTLANLDMPVAGTKGDEPALVSQERATDCLAPLKDAIEQARLTADAANRELNEPEETVLHGFGKQLGGSRKEIMALSKSLVMDQPASVATEATRLSDEACENIRVSRELIRAALRDMGAPSDISEASGPARICSAAQGELLMERRPAVPMPTGPRRPPPPREWEQRPPPPRVGAAPPSCEVGSGRHTGRLGASAHASQYAVGAGGVVAAPQDEG